MIDPVAEDINRIMYLLTEHKKSAANLYNNYYSKFPEKPFWQDLASAKSKQHQLIQKVYFNAKKDGAKFDEEIFRSNAIKISLEWIWRLIEEYEQHSLTNALSYALDLEQAKIEQKYFDIFKADSDEIKQLLPQLTEENKKYIDLLRQELTNIRQINLV